ncbi:Crp/Fnr family transcriptional regulator [Acetobacter conturbans]|uniref:Helix-turn-helix domain-containing protein n=1 Tax=Acetobacter conturbans TaxID=1737472 RepID=A0ABX0JZI8_9PROT|nr:Crp/Fnr family transcriptional regulator [Acetobacter conturbans]NHN88287.1 helix-turn-helix domain-containing protein [Acetobacter conturbans]
MAPSSLPEGQPALRPRRLVIAGMEGCTGCAVCEVRARGICSALNDQELEQLARAAVRVTMPPGRVFVEEGAKADAFFNITAGTAKLFKSLPDGRRQITGFVGVGHFLGLAVSDRYAFGAEAIDQVKVCRFSRERLEMVVEEFPRLERRLLSEAANELVAAQEQMLLLGRKTARERVASFLYEQLLDGYGNDIPSGAKLHFPMTRADIADFLGLTVETVSRTLSGLRRDGLLAMGAGHEISVMAPARLQAIAKGEEG